MTPFTLGYLSEDTAASPYPHGTPEALSWEHGRYTAEQDRDAAESYESWVEEGEGSL